MHCSVERMADCLTGFGRIRRLTLHEIENSGLADFGISSMVGSRFVAVGEFRYKCDRWLFHPKHTMCNLVIR